jgi:hypothetical protein
MYTDNYMAQTEKKCRRFFAGMMCFLFLFAPSTASAQRLTSADSAGIAKKISLYKTHSNTPFVSQMTAKPWVATAEIMGLNLCIWGFNRYAMNEDFAYINGSTIQNNFRHGFVWDNDQIGTNMFLHPYHGSLYYNSARSVGYNYWQSGLFALGGSAVWEMFLENEYPSINDIIATPVGGLALGEVFYRISDLVLNDRSEGGNRLGREIAGFLIAPTRGLTRVLNGDAWRVRPITGRQFGIPDVSAEISVGTRALELKGDILDRGVGGAIDVAVEYGDRFSDENGKPYDYFTFRSNLNVHSSQPILSQLNIVGRLYVTDIWDTKKHFMSWGFYQHFDYYDSDTISDVSAQIPYKFCTPASLGTGFIYQYRNIKNVRFDAFLHTNWVLLGGTLSDHYVVDARNYNLGSGFSTKAGYNITIKDRISLSASYEVYRIYTWKGYPNDIEWNTIDIHDFNYQGDNSRAILHAIRFSTDIRLIERLSLTGVYYTYTRNTHYKYFDDVFSQTSEGRLMLTYNF